MVVNQGLGKDGVPYNDLFSAVFFLETSSKLVLNGVVFTLSYKGDASFGRKNIGCSPERSLGHEILGFEGLREGFLSIFSL